MALKNMLLQLLLSVLIVAQTGQAQDLKNLAGCSVVNGACANGTFIGEFTATSLDECQSNCDQSPNCNFYTFHSTEELCAEYFVCNNVDTSLCPNDCQSGSIDCICSNPGECQGQQIAISFLTLDECIEACYNSADCKWWNYDPEHSLCVQLSNCLSVEANLCPDCLHGEKVCFAQGTDDVEVLFVTGGYSTLNGFDATVEVIPLDSPQMSCPSVPDIPFGHYYGRGFLHESQPVVCTMQDSRDCYKFNTLTWEWENYVQTNSGREFAAGAFLGDDYIILGGENSPRTSEIFSALSETFSYGPDIPYDVWYHCAVSLNSNQVYMTGGHNRVGNWISTVSTVDIETATWSYLPDFTTPRGYHACGIATAADGTSTLVIAGGWDGSFLTDTQLFDLDSGATSWRNGVDIPSGHIDEAFSLPYKQSFMIVGGESSSGAPLDTIWQYDPDNSSMPWILREETLILGRRRGPVAIVVKASDLNCTISA